MKKILSIILSTLAISSVTAQSVTEAVRMGTTDIGGTARYRAMGGAFGAVGGDLSCMGDNPAGMAIYRGTSELNITPHLTTSTSTTSLGSFGSHDANKTQFALSNLGVVFSFRTDDNDNLVNFNLGVGIQRKMDSFRRYRSSIKPSGRFDKFICNLVNNGYDEDIISLMGLPHDYDRYNYGCGVYEFDRGGVAIPQLDGGIGATQRMDTREHTRMDEYQLSGSFNFGDTFYAGFTLGITDMNTYIESTLDEKYDTQKDQYLNYTNSIENRGTGFNVKAGIMYRPIDELRLGLAVHTPTWTTIKSTTQARMYTESFGHQPEYSWPETWEYTYRSPWEVQLSAATVLARRAIISAEVDWRFMRSMGYSESRNYLLDGGDSFFDVNNDFISDYTKTQVTLKLGAEVNIVKGLCIRGGYAYKTSPYKDAALNGIASPDDQDILYFNGSKVDYNTLGTQQYISGGIGYRNGKFGVDLTYSRRIADGKMAAYYDSIVYDDKDNASLVKGDVLNLKTTTNMFDITLSYRFGK